MAPAAGAVVGFAGLAVWGTGFVAGFARGLVVDGTGAGLTPVGAGLVATGFVTVVAAAVVGLAGTEAGCPDFAPVAVVSGLAGTWGLVTLAGLAPGCIFQFYSN